MCCCLALRKQLLFIDESNLACGNGDRDFLIWLVDIHECRSVVTFESAQQRSASRLLGLGLRDTMS